MGNQSDDLATYYFFKAFDNFLNRGGQSRKTKPIESMILRPLVGLALKIMRYT